MKKTLFIALAILSLLLLGCTSDIQENDTTNISSSSESVITDDVESENAKNSEDAPILQSDSESYDITVSENTESNAIPLPVNGGDLTFVSKYVYPVYNIADIAEIIGNEKTEEWANDVFLKLSPEEQESLPPLYRIINDLGISKESLLNVAQGDQDLTEEIINSLYLEDIEEMKKALTNPTALYYDTRIYTFDEISKDANAAIDVPKDILSDYIDFIETVCNENGLIKYMQEEIDHARQINGIVVDE